MTSARALKRSDHLVGVLLCVGYVMLLACTATELGMSRDESFYVHAAKNSSSGASIEPGVTTGSILR